MTEQSRRQYLEELTREALSEYRELARATERRRNDPPQPGDVFTFAETAQLPVFWVVLRRDDSTGRFFVVPGDTNPLTGPGDFGVPEDSACGPLSIRGRFGVWVDEDRFDLERRSGSLERELVGGARDALVAGDDPEEDDSYELDPDYEDWLSDVARKAHDALTRPPARTSVQDVRGRSLRGTTETRLSTRHWLAYAASVILIAGLGGGLLWQRQTIERLERDATREAGGDTGQVNLPLAWLTPRETTRGEAPSVEVPAEASQILLLLEVQDPRPGEYHLEIRRHPDGPVVWSRDGLVKSGPLEIVVLLPRKLLPAGEYHMILGRAGEPEPVAEYGFAVAAPSPASP